MARLSYIQVDRVCNQSCIFCSNPETGAFMPLAKAKALVDMYKSNGDDGVIISGGEPTLYEDLAKLIAYCRQRDMPARIITNGQKTADLQYFRSLVDAGLDGIEVFHHRLDSAAREHFLKLAKRFGLLLTGGSDLHGWGTTFDQLGREPVSDEMIEMLRDRAAR